MALGLNTSTTTGDFLPRIQYDAKAGRIFQVERYQDGGGMWQSEIKEVAIPTQIALDLAGMEVGWIKLNNGVDFQMVKLGEPLPAKPSDDYKQGFRVTVYNKALGLRSWNHTAKCVLQAVDQLHDAFLREADAHRGQWPIVSISATVPVTTGQGAKRSTNYAPVLSIAGWIAPPAREEEQPAPVAAPPAPQTMQAPPVAAPTATVPQADAYF